MKKAVVVDALDSFDEDLAIEQLVQKLLFIDKVEKGLQDVKDGNVLAYEDVKKKFQDKWSK